MDTPHPQPQKKQDSMLPTSNSQQKYWLSDDKVFVSTVPEIPVFI